MAAQFRRNHKCCLKWPTTDFQHMKFCCVESPFLLGSEGPLASSPRLETCASLGWRDFLPSDIKHLS